MSEMNTIQSPNDDELLLKLVRAFAVFDDLRTCTDANLGPGVDLAPILVGPPEDGAFADWRPSPVVLESDVLSELYRDIPGPLPPLFERLIRTFRWAEVDIGRCRLLASLPPGLRGLSFEIHRDDHLFRALTAAGFVQFGRGPDFDYDPVCFDVRSRRPDGDRRITKIDHEEILCNDRVVEVAEIAPTFRRLVEWVCADAAAKSS